MKADFAAKIFAGGKDYQVTRFVILRLMGFVYAIAFLVAINQLVPLIGAHGLTPAAQYLDRLGNHFGSHASAALHVPTLFWFGISDRALSIFAWLGFALSLGVVAGYANAITMSILWAMYMSIVHIGQIWYSYGWETQTLETGFLCIFLCPLLDPRPFPKTPPPLLVIWLFRWLGFRIMLGAGLIKIRGDECWRDLTCLYYHYETQPIPNPISRYLHFAPVVPKIRNGLESSRRADRAVVFFRAASRAPRRRRVDGDVPDFPHNQRQSFLPELSHDHSVPRVL